MSHSSLACSRCGRPTIDGNCRRCAGREDVVLEETRQRLDRSREQLSEWRERLRVKLEEADRRRTQLAKPEARKASHAPTVRLPDEPPPPVEFIRTTIATADDEPSTEVEVEYTAVTSREDPLGLIDRDIEVAADDPLHEPDPFALSTAETVIFREPTPSSPVPGGRQFSDHMTLEEPNASTERVHADRFMLGEPEAAVVRPHSERLVETDIRRTRPDPRAGGSRFDAGNSVVTRASLRGSLLDDDAVGSRPRAEPADQPAEHMQVVDAIAQEYPRPSALLVAAANLLDLCLLLVLPAALLSLPATWLAFERDLGSLWAAHPVGCGAIFLSLFVLLETVFIGAVGRTPGLRLAGLQVIDNDGEIPSFSRAFARSILFPLLVVPGLHRVTGTATVAE